MSHVFLVTRPQGTPMLVAQSGMTIEPEVMSWKATTPFSGRSIIVYPSKERVTPGTVTVDQSFDHFVHALDDAKMLIRVNAIVKEVQVAAAPVQEPLIIAPDMTNATVTSREQEVKKVIEAATKIAKPKKAKTV